MSLPIGQHQAKRAATWLKTTYSGIIQEGITGTPYTIELVCAIACQETSYKWLDWIDKYEPDIILARCVFDATLEIEPGARKAFPQTQQQFRDKYGDALCDMLIDEANKTRALQNWSPRPWLYAGYGIFQYDLQNIVDDVEWFSSKKWYHMSECVAKLVGELNKKAARFDNLRGIVKAYNGTGTAAENYADNVLQFMEWV